MQNAICGFGGQVNFFKKPVFFYHIKPGKNLCVLPGFFMAHTKMTQTDYQKCLKEMFSLHRFGIKLGLDLISDILTKLDNPQNKYKCIHIAGTNGKGSIAAALSAVLREAGFKVGLYTSPHLVRFNERICINNAQISDKDVVAAHEAVKSVRPGAREPTFFEYTTAMAFYLFAKADVDWAVIETGMGGRLDATNIVCPALSIISNISMEHQFYLGNSIARIAFEKGGIIKQTTPVVTGAKHKDAVRVLRDIAASRSAPFYRLGEHFKVRRNPTGFFSYSGLDHSWKKLRTSLPGDHQVDNAGVVLAACEILVRENISMDFSAIKKGIESFKWPGRLELIPGSPDILIDGAHNFMAARILAKYLAEHLKGRDITLVIGILDDKPYLSMLKTLLPFARRIILTQPKTDRSLPTEKLLQAVQSIGRDAEIIGNVGDAVSFALRMAPPDGVACITGSLYVVGEAKEALMAHGIQS
jgi:dihydrofolate synthase / folylpolyglutamate synthase